VDDVFIRTDAWTQNAHSRVVDTVLAWVQIRQQPTEKGQEFEGMIWRNFSKYFAM